MRIFVVSQGEYSGYCISAVGYGDDSLPPLSELREQFEATLNVHEHKVTGAGEWERARAHNDRVAKTYGKQHGLDTSGWFDLDDCFIHWLETNHGVVFAEYEEARFS